MSIYRFIYKLTQIKLIENRQNSNSFQSYFVGYDRDYINGRLIIIESIVLLFPNYYLKRWWTNILSDSLEGKKLIIDYMVYFRYCYYI